MSVRMRFGLEGLGALLDLGNDVRVVGAEVSGSFLDLHLEGVRLQVTPNSPDAHALAARPATEVTAEYSVTVDAAGHSRRSFVRFKLPEGPPSIPIGATDVSDVDLDSGTVVPPPALAGVEETTPPSGPGSRGGGA